MAIVLDNKLIAESSEEGRMKKNLISTGRTFQRATHKQCFLALTPLSPKLLLPQKICKLGLFQAESAVLKIQVRISTFKLCPSILLIASEGPVVQPKARFLCLHVQLHCGLFAASKLFLKAPQYSMLKQWGLAAFCARDKNYRILQVR